MKNENFPVFRARGDGVLRVLLFLKEENSYLFLTCEKESVFGEEMRERKRGPGGGDGGESKNDGT